MLEPVIAMGVDSGRTGFKRSREGINRRYRGVENHVVEGWIVEVDAGYRMGARADLTVVVADALFGGRALQLLLDHHPLDTALEPGDHAYPHSASALRPQMRAGASHEHYAISHQMLQQHRLQKRQQALGVGF